MPGPSGTEAANAALDGINRTLSTLIFWAERDRNRALKHGDAMDTPDTLERLRQLRRVQMD